jgi:hypothetical protein
LAKNSAFTTGGSGRRSTRAVKELACCIRSDFDQPKSPDRLWLMLIHL